MEPKQCQYSVGTGAKEWVEGEDESGVLRIGFTITLRERQTDYTDRPVLSHAHPLSLIIRPSQGLYLVAKPGPAITVTRGLERSRRLTGTRRDCGIERKKSFTEFKSKGMHAACEG